MAKRKTSKRQQHNKNAQPTGQSVQWWVFAAGLALVAIVVALSLTQRPPREEAEAAAQEGGPGQLALGDQVVDVDQQWTQPPAMALDPDADYRATIALPVGDVVIDLFEDEAPLTVNNFVFLANQGFYDGVVFHRVFHDFMAQSGDPTGTGAGGPGYTFADETDNGLTFDRPYRLAMANSGPNTNGSQFFITYVETPWLDGNHTIFGEVVAGEDLLLAIPERDPMTATTPGMAMDSVTIEALP